MKTYQIISLAILLTPALAACAASGGSPVDISVQEDISPDPAGEDVIIPDTPPDETQEPPPDMPDVPETPDTTDTTDTTEDPGVDLCTPVGGVSYDTLPISGPPTDRPAAEHPDLNVKLRGWAPADPSESRDFVDYGGDTDTLSPKLYSIYADDAFPGFGDLFVVGCWDGIAVCTEGGYPVHIAGLLTDPGEVIEMPTSGYDIGDGFAAMVLYADEDSITLKLTREDNVVYGYTIHMVGLCVEPDLLALYRSMDAAGRESLPVLRGNQPLGRAGGSQVLVAIRDTGAFMDPRSRKDWW
jgi:hypothetical protein